MGLANMQNQDQIMNLVLSTDAKPRLKWTPQLHQRFVEAVDHLGGSYKATPKSLMRMMGIPGLTLYHLKSHLQKYRLGKTNHQSETCSGSKEASSDEMEACRREKGMGDHQERDQIRENVQITQAIQMQMEVQRKLHQQIEVQRHLQLRIEAQGKYLQKVLTKAQETLSDYSCSSEGVEVAKAELSQLVSMVSNSSYSELTETTDLSLDNNHQRQSHGARSSGAGCSAESSLTSSECSGGGGEERERMLLGSRALPLLDGPGTRSPPGGKRGRSSGFDDRCVEQRAASKRSAFDLNREVEGEFELGPRKPTIDLNCQGTEQPLLQLSPPHGL